MPGAPGKTPGESFRSVFSEGPSHFGSSRKFGNSRDGHSRMGVYCPRNTNTVTLQISSKMKHMKHTCIHPLRGSFNFIMQFHW